MTWPFSEGAEGAAPSRRSAALLANRLQAGVRPFSRPVPYSGSSYTSTSATPAEPSALVTWAV
jgi:hypothetical protein